MNTQAHVILNTALLGRDADRRVIAAIVLGSMLPDLQIVAFFVVEVFVHGTPHDLIWSQRYFEVHESFDWLNSLPLAALGAAVAHWRGAWVARGFFAGLFLHSCLDLPLHHDDAHRHFLPLSTWRFESPFSYWDPAHHGGPMALLEMVTTAVAARTLWNRWPSRGLAMVLGGVGLVYIAMAVFYLRMWM